MRKFVKISKNQFIEEFGKEKVELYNDIKLPYRKTKYSAGYDISLVEDITIAPGECIKISLAISASMETNEFLMIVMRHSLGYKYNLRLCNQVGIIDHDYYNNQENEGSISAKIQNEGNEEIKLNKGEAILQGIFIKYQTVDDEEEIKLDRNDKGVTTLV